METWRFRTGYCVLVCVLVGFGVSIGHDSTPSSTNGSIQTVMVPAPSLRGNLLGDPTTQKAIVYLPAGYSGSYKQYPVLYLLHGFSLRSILPDWEETVRVAMDNFVAAHPDEAFIVVIPNGSNAVDGSFYMNSVVGGNWDGFISQDLVSFVDSHFRTVADRRSRAIAGHSMGGFGALRMLMIHPDIFATGYAMSPCCLDLVADMTNANLAWFEVLRMRSVSDIEKAAENQRFWATALAAFAIAASPDPSSPLRADLPYRSVNGHVIAVRAVIDRWKHVMPLEMLASHLPNLRRAGGIAIDYGYEDQFTHIPLTSREFGEQLLKSNIPARVEGYDGDHTNKIRERLATVVIPYIANQLRFQK